MMVNEGVVCLLKPIMEAESIEGSMDIQSQRSTDLAASQEFI